MNETDTGKYVGKRVTDTIIDYTLFFVLFFIYVYKFGTPNDEGGYTVTGLSAVVPVLFWVSYFIGAEYLLGGTMGHMLFRLKIKSMDNNAPTLGQIVLRRISDALEISWCFGLVAYILVKNTPNHQRLGDLWAKTLVVGE